MDEFSVERYRQILRSAQQTHPHLDAGGFGVTLVRIQERLRGVDHHDPLDKPGKPYRVVDFWVAVEYIRAHPPQPGDSSYGLKHEAERFGQRRFPGLHVSNGLMIVALHHAGIPFDIDGRNAVVAGPRPSRRQPAASASKSRTLAMAEVRRALRGLRKAYAALDERLAKKPLEIEVPEREVVQVLEIAAILMQALIALAVATSDDPAEEATFYWLNVAATLPLVAVSDRLGLSFAKRSGDLVDLQFPGHALGGHYRFWAHDEVESMVTRYWRGA